MVRLPKINYAQILEQRECPGCANRKPGRKNDCMIFQHIVYGAKVSEQMDAWMHKQIFTGACRQRVQRKG